MFKKGKRLSWSVMTLLIILGMLLTACGQAAQEPAPTSTAMPIPPTYTPYAEEEAEEPTEEVADTPEPEVVEEEEEIVNAFGVVLPDDAAPADQQYVRIMGIEGVTTDFFVSVYKRGNSNCDILTTPFVRLNKNFELLPAGAVSWKQSEDGTVWTFDMDPELTWSDGNPVTADDVVFSFQYGADPEHAWDFTWFWGDILNWNEAVAGEVPLDEIGVKKIDDFTVEFTLTAPAPYFLSKALYVRPLSKVAFEKHGEYYNNTPETSVSSTPWILTEWTKGKQMVFGPNLNYTGNLKPYLEGLTIVFGETTAEFAAYRNNEIDQTGQFTPADIQLIQQDPELKEQYHPGFGDFRTYYVGFNTYAEPFDDLNVRKAFSMAIDRQAIIDNIVTVQGIPAYSFLMPGFPAADSDTYKAMDVNQYDPAAAQALLAEAGYPGGEGFPALELWLRDENDLNQAVAAGVASMVSQNLGIEVQVSNKESKLFMDELNAHTLTFYMVSYGFDYLDPSNMLGIWTSNGRHAWLNEEFDQLIADASSYTGDPAIRTEMFMDAEKILVEDVGAAFIYHQTPGQIYKPYLKGTELEPDNVGVAAIHWPNFESIGMLMPTTYISNDVENYR
ncbi:MAG: peptide ABC transporter substrate-binding protein [Anaerolineaceae bacterium]|nr:peptide ABC transporter substrate-binding protein [Anaerolineaceae bacterium]